MNFWVVRRLGNSPSKSAKSHSSCFFSARISPSGSSGSKRRSGNLRCIYSAKRRVLCERQGRLFILLMFATETTPGLHCEQYERQLSPRVPQQLQMGLIPITPLDNSLLGARSRHAMQTEIHVASQF